MIETMSTTPGIGDGLPVSATETARASVITQANGAEVRPNTNADVLRATEAAIENAILESPIGDTNAGLASLAGVSPGEIGPTVIQSEPAPQPPEPTLNLVSAETSNTPSTEPMYFPYVAEANKALTEAKARNASQADIESLELKLQQATSREGLLMSGMTLIQIDAEIAEAQQRGASKEEMAELNTRKNEAIKAREALYEESFKQVEAHVKRNEERDPRSFEQTLDDFMLKEAREIRDAMQYGLTRATEAGNEDEIKTAKLRLEAAEMHVGIIEKKKGKGIKSLIKSILAAAGATTASDTLKVTKGELTPQKGH